MNSREFGIACKELNHIYRDLFGEVPVPTEYSCTREQFFDALKQSVAERKPIETYLVKGVRHNDGRFE